MSVAPNHTEQSSEPPATVGPVEVDQSASGMSWLAAQKEQLHPDDALKFKVTGVFHLIISGRRGDEAPYVVAEKVELKGEDGQVILEFEPSPAAEEMGNAPIHNALGTLLGRIDVRWELEHHTADPTLVPDHGGLDLHDHQ